MTIEKLSSGSYRIKQMKDGKTYRLTIDHKPSKREAEDLIRELMDRRSPVTTRDSFEQCAIELLESKDKILSPSTLRSYKGILSHLSERFRNYPLRDIEQIHVQHEINEYAQGRSAKSVKNAHGFISSVLTTFNPSLTLHTALPAKEIKEDYIPTDDEVRAVFDHEKGTRYFVPFALAALALRRSEICALDISDLDDDNTLYIHRALVPGDGEAFTLREINKTSLSRRRIKIPDELAELIRKQGRIYDGAVSGLNQRLHLVQKELGIHPFKLHSLRKYFPSMCHSLGIPDKYIMDYGGWKTDHVMKDVYMRAERDKKDMIQQRALDHINGLF